MTSPDSSPSTRAGAQRLVRAARGTPREAPRTLEEPVEPWLFARGFVRMTMGGRVATPRLRRPATERGAPNVRRGVELMLAPT